MARILLVHGSGRGAWCWREVLPLLAAAGHEASAIDLPGCGSDPTPREAVTLEGTVQAILAAIDGPAVLVGHSLGGISITAAAEAAPGKVARLVYVTAWVPGDGQSASRIREASQADALLSAIRSDDGGVTTTFTDESLEPLFYHDCPPGTVALARARLTPQPASIGRTPVRLTGHGAAIPRSYILCSEDRVIPHAAQAAQCAGWDDIRRLPCGHSPFFAFPEALAAHIAEIASGTH